MSNTNSHMSVVATLKERAARDKASRDQLSALLPQLAQILNDVAIASAQLTVPEKANMIRSVMEVYGADSSLDEFVSWFELDDDRDEVENKTWATRHAKNGKTPRKGDK